MMARRRDDAVSTVVSAVLVFALILMVLSVYVSTIVPDQVESAEARHMRRVSSSLGDINTQMVSSISLGREGEFSTQVDLGTQGISNLAIFESSGTMAMEEDSFFTNFLCGTPKVLSRNGQPTPGATYAALGGAPTIMQTLVVLDAQITAYAFSGVDDTATFTATSNGNAIATLAITLVDSEKAIRVSTWDSAARLIVSQNVQNNLGATIPSYLLNVMDTEYGFSSLLADAPGEIQLTTSSTTAALQHFAVYWTADETIGVIGDGRDLPFGFQRTVDPVSLVFRSNNAQFMEQTYSLEGGAVVLAQDQGQYLSLAPFSIQADGGQNLLRLTFLNMSGEGQVSGSHRATITAALSGPASTILTCAAPIILIGSEYPDAWLSSWADELNRAGLDETQVTRVGDLVQVALTGAWTVVLQEGRVSLRVS